MKKQVMRILTLVSIIVFLAVFAAGYKLPIKSATVRAVGDLAVDWGVAEGNPIFVVPNMAPGQSEPREVNVSNGASTARPVGVRGLKTSEIGDLSTVLDLVISENGTDLYGGTSPTGPKTLGEFFNESAGPDGLSLSTIGPGDTTIYTFRVTFQESAGNDFQNTNVVFDLKVGIAIAIPEECQGIEFDFVDGLPIFGTDKDDEIRGTNGNDLIFGLEGNDRINGSNGNDCLVGGSGNDRIDGSNGQDVLVGNEGDDRFDGSNGNDLIIGGLGNDNLDGSNGDDKLWGNEGNDNLKGANGNDRLEGQDGSDLLEGGNGDDTLLGGLGVDSANGRLGTDTCEAEAETNCEL